MGECWSCSTDFAAGNVAARGVPQPGGAGAGAGPAVHPAAGAGDGHQPEVDTRPLQQVFHALVGDSVSHLFNCFAICTFEVGKTFLCSEYLRLG